MYLRGVRQEFSLRGRERRVMSNNWELEYIGNWGQVMEGFRGSIKDAVCDLQRTTDMFSRVMKTGVLKRFIWRK